MGIIGLSKTAGMELLGLNVIGTGFFALLLLILSLRLHFMTMGSVGVSAEPVVGVPVHEGPRADDKPV